MKDLFRTCRIARTTSVVALLAVCAACTGAGDSRPYATVFSTVGDTVVASTTGDVPDSLLRHVVVDWSIRTDTANEIIGDIHSMTVAPDGTVWVFDNSAPGLWRIDANGAAMHRVGRSGGGPGEYRSVNGLAVARDGALVLWDDENARLTTYAADGTYRSSTSLGFSACCGLPVTIDTTNRTWLTTPIAIAAAASGQVDPSAFVANRIAYLRFDSAGAFIDTVMTPHLPGEDGRVSAVQGSADGIGGAVRQVPYATYPKYAVSPLGHVVSAMARPYAVHLQSGGRPLRITNGFTPPPVDEAERTQWRAEIEWFMRREQPAFRWNGPDIPHDKPPIAGLAVGLDGRIWVQLSVPSESFDPGPPRGPAAQRAPQVTFRPRENQWDVFEPDGRYLGRISAPRNTSVLVTRGDFAWGVVRDENDVASIVRLRLEPGW